jgi:hypothetical protein
MNVQAILEVLRGHLAELNVAIAVIEQLERGGKRRRGRPRKVEPVAGTKPAMKKWQAK